MKIAIVGAGIAGVTTAHELATLGHEVTVFERRGAVAEEGSFAASGLLSPASLVPWLNPADKPRTVMRQMRERLLPESAGLPGWSQWRWQRRAQAGFNAAAASAHRTQLLALGRYSQARMRELQERLPLAFDQAAGVLVLLPAAADRERAQAMVPLLQEAGIQAQELDAQQALQVEPALNPQQPLAGAVHLPDDGVGNCRQFALGLRKQAQTLGVRFEFDTTVRPLTRANPTTVQTMHTARGPQSHSFDAVVMCAGAESAALVRPTGLALPLRAVWGHSISALFNEPMNAPRGGVVDQARQVVITRLGQRVRVSGGRQWLAQAPARDEAILRGLYEALQDWFPQAVRLGSRQVSVQQWKGAGAWLPDGRPVLGASGVPGVWLNLGHGEGGWTLACGAARVVADQVSGRIPGMDASGLGVERLRR